MSDLFGTGGALRRAPTLAEAVTWHRRAFVQERHSGTDAVDPTDDYAVNESRTGSNARACVQQLREQFPITMATAAAMFVLQASMNRSTRTRSINSRFKKEMTEMDARLIRTDRKTGHEIVIEDFVMQPTYGVANLPMQIRQGFPSIGELVEVSVHHTEHTTRLEISTATATVALVVPDGRLVYQQLGGVLPRLARALAGEAQPPSARFDGPAAPTTAQRIRVSGARHGKPAIEFELGLPSPLSRDGIDRLLLDASKACGFETGRLTFGRSITFEPTEGISVLPDCAVGTIAVTADDGWFKTADETPVILGLSACSAFSVRLAEV